MAQGTRRLRHQFRRRHEALTRDGRYLYAIDADAQNVFGWTVGSDDVLASISAFEGVPDTVAGLAAS